MVHEERIAVLNDRPVRRGRYVLYWMQASQRTAENPALEVAIERANAHGLPLVVGFGLTADYPEANARHFAFMLQGLAETAREIEQKGAAFVLRLGDPSEVAAELAGEAAEVVTDRGYLRHQVAWRRKVASAVGCRVTQVEADVVVPVEVASDHEEYAARTLRRKHRAQWEEYLQPTPADRLDRRDPPRLAGESLDKLTALLDRLDVDRSVPPSEVYHGGTSEAMRRLKAFLRGGLRRYGGERNDPSLGIESHMSPYLHFGQISPVAVARAVRDARASQEAKEAYLEELLIRRELAINFVRFNRRYDGYASLPGWARTTLQAHRVDARARTYTRRQLEAGRTDDPYWNAAMAEMRITGKMHNYMRMYWGKKILEWTPTPVGAYRRLLAMNNRFFIDGRDPVSYANVAWIFGKHDRPWAEREVFGTVRAMTAGGLERKFDIDAYVRAWGFSARKARRSE